ncbi:MAG: glycine cleavage system aminomethyltransferase GcvT [Endozoicomonas sp. (ex Botrylloides leachii)]|nr:glycine cleavage system aminomethyltransferase GcvT [Endozoicomonas sp. (ex Botrylloides leachii)]
MATHANELKKTPLHDLHVDQGAKMVPFAGYDMPVQFAGGVKKEHLHTRTHAGLFDVSHMGQIRLTGPHASADLERLVPVDIIDLPEDKQRYALFTHEQGGILDDLMVSRFPTEGENEHLYLVVNAACKEQDIALLQAGLSTDTQMDILDNRALIALQGPDAVKALARIAPEVTTMVFMDTRELSIGGIDCFISRSGYTGEDGFEISIPAEQAEILACQLLEQPEVEWAGLGARDSLRLEAGLCLYGHDISVDTTPIEGSLIWAISKVRREGGDRAGGFPGAAIILKQIETKVVSKKRVGLSGTSRAPVREGADIINSKGENIGCVTSGTYGPTLASPVAMAYVATEYSLPGTEVFALVRGKKLPMTVTKMPFIQPRYYRG